MKSEAPKSESMQKWRRNWLLIAIPALIVVSLVGHFLWFEHSSFKSVYRSHTRAEFSFVLGMCQICYAFYAVLTMLSQKPSRREGIFHLTYWTLVPPLWFFFEWFFLFDNIENIGYPNATEILKHGQEVVSRVWAAVLALLLSLNLSEVLKQQRADSDKAHTNDS